MTVDYDDMFCISSRAVRMSKLIYVNAPNILLKLLHNSSGVVVSVHFMSTVKI